MRRVSGPEEMEREAARFAAQLAPHTGGATVVSLEGDLGAGKTTFVRGVARAFGIEESVTSPTFVIEKVYPLESRAFARLIHIDAYRLESSHDMEVLGWKEMLEEPSNLILVEWPERIAHVIPPAAHTVRFAFVDDSVREISYGN